MDLAAGRRSPRRPLPGAAGLAVLGLLLLLMAAPVRGEPPPSDYLERHADDPVDWQRWGPQVLEAAQRQGRLIYVMSGYAACTWCQRMHAGALADPSVARRLNRDFVPVLADRDVWPALDRRLGDFVERTQGVSGWPLNVFLTPEGYPLVGTTYLGRAQLLEVLDRLQERWTDNPAALTDLARRAARADAGSGGPLPAAPPPDAGPRLAAALAEAAMERADRRHGGFGDTHKFAAPGHLRALLTLVAHNGDPAVAAHLRRTLDAVAWGGLRDPVSGGLFRYAEAADWSEPRLEQRLAGNAAMAAVFLEAGDILDEDRYRRVGRSLAGFLLETLGNPATGLVGGVSAADAAGDAFRYSVADLEALLEPPVAEVAALAWGLDDTDGRRLPGYTRNPGEVATRLGLERPEVAARLETGRDVLRQARADALATDERRPAAANGLALRAMALAAADGGSGRYSEAGAALRRFILEELWTGDIVVAHAGADAAGSLADQAYVAWGLLAWWHVSGDPDDLRQARRIADAAWRHHFTDEGWIPVPEGVLPDPVRDKALPDGVLPSPSAALTAVARSLAEAGADGPWAARARRAMAGGVVVADDKPFEFASHIALLISDGTHQPL